MGQINFFELKITAAEHAATIAQTPITFFEGLAFVRSDVAPQKIKIAAGSFNINTIASQITSDLAGVTASTENDEIIIGR